MNILGFHKHDARLVLNLFKMNLRDRYLGSILGLIWAILNPILMLSMYTFVFGFVFKAKLPGAETSMAYIIWLFSGFVPYLAISECMAITASCVIGNASLVKNIMFKTETLPLAATLVGAVPFVVGMSFLLILLIFAGQLPTWHLIALIPVIALQFIFLAGLGMFLGATTVFIRDITQIISTVILLIAFFTPIFYTMEMMPRPIQILSLFNPFYYMIQPYRDIFMDHKWPNVFRMLCNMLFSGLFFILGLKYFRRLKGYFGMSL